jgi:hypothetical protein
MFKEYALKTDLSAEALRTHFEQMGVDPEFLSGLEPRAYAMQFAAKLGMRPECMLSFPETAREFVRAFRALKASDADLNRLVGNLDELLAAFEHLWNQESLNRLTGEPKDKTEEAFRSEIINLCFMQFLRTCDKHLPKEHPIVALLQWLFDSCRQYEDKNFIWMHTRATLEQPVSLTLIRQGGKQQVSFIITDKMKSCLLEEHALMDPIIEFLIPLSTASEEQLRKDLHSYIQELIKSVNRFHKPKFKHARGSYPHLQQSLWKQIWENIYDFMAPYFEWPLALADYECSNIGAAQKEFDGYRSIKVARLFPKNKADRKPVP